jgi:hypothetical protein
MTLKRSQALFAICLTFAIAGEARSQGSITVAPGSGPAGGYLPLSLFGITPIAGMGDDSHHTVTSSGFMWGGAIFNSVDVSSNGFLSVGAPSGGPDFINHLLPSTALPNGLLAPFWADLNPGAGGGIRAANLTDGVRTWLVVDWQDVPLFENHSILNSFEVWMRLGTFEDITFSYGSVGYPGVDATIGAENIDGTVGSTYYYNGSGTLPHNSELRVSSTGNPNVVPEPATLSLLGTGLLAIVGFERRRRLKKEAVPSQASRC